MLKLIQTIFMWLALMLVLVNSEDNNVRGVSLLFFTSMLYLGVCLEELKGKKKE